MEAAIACCSPVTHLAVAAAAAEAAEAATAAAAGALNWQQLQGGGGSCMLHSLKATAQIVAGGPLLIVCEFFATPALTCQFICMFT